jgi:hypothetical protein
METSRKKFFFEKKNQKTFPGLVCATGDRLGSKGKSLLVLFFRKELLPYIVASV